MRYTYTSDDAAIIRALADPFADVDTMPDDSILVDLILNSAESRAFSVLGLDFMPTPDQDAVIRQAILHFAAAYIVDMTPQVYGGQLGENSFRVTSNDNERRSARLLSYARDLLRGLMAPGTPSGFGFALAPGGRGR